MQGIEEEIKGQYLTFTLDDEYAIEISYVIEVLEYQEILKIPRTPEYFSGIINNRGKIVPVIDLARQFGIDLKVDYKNSNLVILRLFQNEEEFIIGVVVKNVNEVIFLEESKIDFSSKILKSRSFNITKVIKGIAKRSNSFIILLDIDKIFNMKDLSDFKNTTLEE